jgi:hypothetical protein
MESKKRILIIIPAYNGEEGSVGKVVRNSNLRRKEKNSGFSDIVVWFFVKDIIF